MLQSEQSVISKQRRFRMPVDGKNAALIFWLMRGIHISLSVHRALDRKVPRLKQFSYIPTQRFSLRRDD